MTEGSTGQWKSTWSSFEKPQEPYNMIVLFCTGFLNLVFTGLPHVPTSVDVGENTWIKSVI